MDFSLGFLHPLLGFLQKLDEDVEDVRQSIRTQ